MHNHTLAYFNSDLEGLLKYYVLNNDCILHALEFAFIRKTSIGNGVCIELCRIRFKAPIACINQREFI